MERRTLTRVDLSEFGGVIGTGRRQVSVHPHVVILRNELVPHGIAHECRIMRESGFFEDTRPVRADGLCTQGQRVSDERRGPAGRNADKYVKLALRQSQMRQRGRICVQSSG
jgi:hypothetical protein